MLHAKPQLPNLPNVSNQGKWQGMTFFHVNYEKKIYLTSSYLVVHTESIRKHKRIINHTRDTVIKKCDEHLKITLDKN